MIKFKRIFMPVAASLSVLSLTACEKPPTGTPSDSKKLEFIAPENEPLRVGLAGQYPADIARYLLASGAGQAALSPDGISVAYTSSKTGKAQLYIMPRTGGAGRQITFGNGVTFFRWAPDGDTLIYGADNDGNEQENYYTISTKGDSERLLLPAVKGGFRVFGGFSGNGKSIAYASTERNSLDFDIYIADIQTGKSRRVYEGKYGFFAHSVSPDGSQIIVSQTVGEDADNLYLLDVNSGKLTTVSKPSSRASHADHGIVWAPDGSAFYFSTNTGREFSALSKYTLKSGKTSTLRDANYDIENITLCGEKSDQIAYTENQNGFDSLHFYSLTGAKPFTSRALPQGVYRLSCSPGSDSMIARIGAWNRPGDIFHTALNTGKTTQIFTSNYAGLSPKKLIKPTSITLPARDGVSLQGLLYMPKSGSYSADKPPIVFEVHGGPAGQARPSYNGTIQYLLGRGIAVFQTNVRGSTGFGRSYSTLDDKEKRLDSVRDLIDMLAFFEKDGRVDARRAAVSGGSYGGYMVNAVLAAYPDSFAAGVSRYSVADWVTALEVASPALKASDIIEYGDIKDPKWKAFYTQYSPIRQADKIKAPVLFSHGVMDPRIDIAETETMVRALRANGIDADYIRIPDEGHGWRKLKNRLFYARREAEFLEKHLGMEIVRETP